jgi:predicted CXXCH cytochrome family protein
VLAYLFKTKPVKGHLGLIALFAFFFSLASFNNAHAQDGKALFQANCASCHNPLKDATGPALKGMSARTPGKEWLHKWVKNPMAMISSGDKYANEIYVKWNKTAMTAFPNLSEAEIDAIINYVESVEAPKADEPKPGAAVEETGDNTMLYTMITIILALVAIVLWRVNKTLDKVSNEKQGLPNKKDVPLLRSKLFIAIAGVLIFALAGYWIANGAINTARQQNYMPEQPIFYSHKVHAGINQINCLYCHSAAEQGRQAMIPSTNVCMNCHKQIDEYTGEKLYTYEGKEVNGTAEIHKLYEYAGWDKDKKQYKRDAQGNIMAKPIEWVKIHNLPDHVYFNHSQHVKVGQVQCQSCHGAIQEMDEVKQFAPLTMGWCVNCHRQTKVQFENNDYYKIFEKYHQEMKDGKREGVTVEDIGGLECQKCHY